MANENDIGAKHPLGASMNGPGSAASGTCRADSENPITKWTRQTGGAWRGHESSPVSCDDPAAAPAIQAGTARAARILGGWAILLIVLWASTGTALAQGTLQFEPLGPGKAGDDPSQLASAASGDPQALIRDSFDGTWWRGQLMPSETNGTDSSPRSAKDRSLLPLREKAARSAGSGERSVAAAMGTAHPSPQPSPARGEGAFVTPSQLMSAPFPSEAHAEDALPLVFVFKGGYSTTLNFWHPASGWRVERDRFLHPGPDWSASPDLLVVVPPAIRAGEAFFLHVQDPTQRRIRPEVRYLDEYLSIVGSRRDAAISSAAALITLALLAAVFVNSLGNPAYRHLALMACMAAGYVLCLNGDFFRLVGIDGLMRFGPAVHRTFAMLAIAFSHFFIIAFLRLTARRPRAASVLRVLAWAQIGIFVASWFEGARPSTWGATASNLLLLIGVPTVLWEAWVAHRQGIRAGRYVLWAWSPALILLTLWVFALQDWLPRAAVDLGSLVSIGLAVQVAVLVFGLGDDSARLRSERDRATTEAEHDALTGVLNRRALQSRLQELHAKGGREAQPCSLAYLDLDHFKRINDDYGHAAGDQCLRQLVKRLGHQLRSDDLLARIGGEEFMWVLHGQDGPAALARAEALRLRVAAEPFTVDGQRIAFTTSIGIAEWRPGESSESAMQRADQALYRAKSEGRNRVVLDEPDEVIPLAILEEST